MQERKTTRELGWNKIPAARRHVYVYALLLLGAVVGNNVKNAFAGPVQDDQPTAALRANAARLEGMKDTAASLYR